MRLKSFNNITPVLSQYLRHVFQVKKTGTGFSIDPREYPHKETGKTTRFVITAFHVVKNAQRVCVHLYQNEKDSEGEWKYEICKAEISGLDIVRDVALLAIPCDTCNCTRLGALSARRSTVNPGESILMISDSAKRRRNSFINGKLSDTNFTLPLMHIAYKHFLQKDNAPKTWVHALTGTVRLGDSGSAVMDSSSNVIGMISAGEGDINYCVAMEEIYKAWTEILNMLSPRFVGCTAYETAFLGRKFWGVNPGKSIKEMSALATAMDARYFAVAHDVSKTYAFTFDALWWEVLPGNDKMKEDVSQCLCEVNSFTDGYVLKATSDGMVACGCLDNSCWKNPKYEKRIDIHNDRRWAIYETVNVGLEKNGHYVPSKKCQASMKDIADRITYWKEKVDVLEDELKKDVKSGSKHQSYIAVVIAVLCLIVGIIFCTCK